MRRPTQNDSAYSGFEYRWNYEEYQKSLQKQRRRASGSGMQAFFLTTAFVFLICFCSLVMVLGAAFMRDHASVAVENGVSDLSHISKDVPESDGKVEKSDTEITTEALPSHPIVYEEQQETSQESLYDEEAVGVLGILGENITYADAVRFRLPIGVRIMSVLENEIAARAGLRRDDILLSIENTPITTLAALAAWEETLTQSKRVSICIYRGGEELSFELVINQNGE